MFGPLIVDLSIKHSDPHHSFLLFYWVTVVFSAQVAAGQIQLLGQNSAKGHIPGHCYASAGAAIKGGLRLPRGRRVGSKRLNPGKTHRIPWNTYRKPMENTA